MDTHAVLPRSFQPYLWSTNIDLLDLQKHRQYIVHQLLSYGDLDAFAWLKRTYSLPTLQEIFINTPAKVYTDRSFYFVRKFLLSLDQENLQKERYVNLVS